MYIHRIAVDGADDEFSIIARANSRIRERSGYDTANAFLTEIRRTDALSIPLNAILVLEKFGCEIVESNSVH